MAGRHCLSWPSWSTSILSWRAGPVPAGRSYSSCAAPPASGSRTTQPGGWWRQALCWGPRALAAAASRWQRDWRTSAPRTTSSRPSPGMGPRGTTSAREGWPRITARTRSASGWRWSWAWRPSSWTTRTSRGGRCGPTWRSRTLRATAWRSWSPTPSTRSGVARSSWRAGTTSGRRPASASTPASSTACSCATNPYRPPMCGAGCWQQSRPTWSTAASTCMRPWPAGGSRSCGRPWPARCRAS
mmetsp:Transcript_101528/g.302894  ORF Transcript_101528/g.302894 Transcript_101528/m.302894 type:complete len:243 (+) Transcript_101528:279-1007(+)